MRYVFLSAFAIFLAGGPALAAESVRVSQSDVITLALLKSNQALDAVRTAAIGDAEATELQTFENPELQFDLEKERNSGGAGMAAEFFQPLRLSDLTGARREAAESLRKLTTTEQHIARAALIAEAGSTYTAFWAAQQREQLFSSARREARRAADILARGAAQGQTDPAALELFQGDAAGWDAKLAANQADLLVAGHQLSKLTGRNMAGSRLAAPDLSALPPAAQLIEAAGSHPNWRNLLDERLKAAQARLRIAKDEGRLPEIGPRITYSRGAGGGSQSYGFGLSLRVPLWDTKAADRQRYQADISRAEQEISRSAEYGLPQSIAALYARAEASAREYTLLKNSVLPRYRSSYQTTRNLLSQGQSDPMALWQVREKVTEAESQLIESMVNAQLARLELAQETGMIEELSK